MGQKTHPRGFRLFNRKNWRSKWYAKKQEFADFVHEDFQIRRFLDKKPGVSEVVIKRKSDKLEVVVRTARPGLIIGKKGVEIEALKAQLAKLVHKNSADEREVWVEVEEIKRPDLDATLVAEGIKRQLERRISFRRAMKRAIQSSREAGALGIKVQVSGRLGGAEIARREEYKEGSVPLHTLRAEIDYGVGRAETTYGSIGIKVWIYQGEETEVSVEG